MYHDHFGLQRAPFRITPDTELFYAGGGRGEVLEALVYAVTSGEGIVKVTGEVGTGKTMICRMLEVRLPSSVEVVYIANPGLSPEDILHAIALEMNLPLEGAANRLTVMHSLQQRLLEMHARNRRVVVFVEEAQGMPMETLEEIRLLSNLETQRDKLLQIVLFGQPELDEALDRSNIRQLRERITHSFRLEPLSRDEVREYVRFRMRAVGYRGPDVFKEGAYRRLARASEGLVRRVNILADKALLAAFADDTHSVCAGHMKIAIEDGNFGARPNRRVAWLAGVSVLLLAAVGTLFVIDSTSLQQRLQRLVIGDASPVQAPAPPAVPVAARMDEASAPTLTASAAGAAPITPGQTPPAAADRPATSSPGTQPEVAMSGAIESPQTSLAAPAQSGYSSPAHSASADESSSLSAAVAPAAPPPAVVPEPAIVEPGSPVVVDSGSTDTAAAPAATAVLASAAPVAASEASAPAKPAAAPETAVSETAAEPLRGPAVSAEASRPETVADAAPKPALTTAAAAGVRSNTPLLAERVAATTAWLQSARGSNLCIQLLLADAGRQVNLESFLRRMQRLGVYEQIYVYETVIGARDWFGVLYGDFSSFDDARQTLEGLPAELRRHKPFIRNVRDIVGPG